MIFDTTETCRDSNIASIVSGIYEDFRRVLPHQEVGQKTLPELENDES